MSEEPTPEQKKIAQLTNELGTAKAKLAVAEREASAVRDGNYFAQLENLLDHFQYLVGLRRQLSFTAEHPRFTCEGEACFITCVDASAEIKIKLTRNEAEKFLHLLVCLCGKELKE